MSEQTIKQPQDFYAEHKGISEIIDWQRENLPHPSAEAPNDFTAANIQEREAQLKRAKEHYVSNQEEYHTRALEDAAQAGVEIHQAPNPEK